MMIDIQAQQPTAVAPMEPSPLLVIQDVELADVGGGMGAACHF